MIRASFGKRLSHLPTAPVIQVVLVPKGAAASSDIWAMGEALRMFVTEAQERALFAWADTFDVEASTPPGILISQ